MSDPLKTIYKRTPPILSILLAVAFLGYFWLLERNYCLSADDFAGIYYSSKGIPGFTFAWHFYWIWEGPFLSHVIHGLLMRLVVIGVKPLFVLLSVKCALVVSVNVLLMVISKRFALNWNRYQTLFASIVFVLTLYLISPQQTEIWHWLTGMLYLYPLIFLVLGMAAIVHGRLLFAVIPLSVVMQSRATYALLVFGLIALISGLNFLFGHENRKRWLLMTALLLVFLTAYLLAPGNYMRMTAHGNSVSFMMSQFKIGLHNLFISYNLAKMDRIFLASLAAFPVLASGVQLPMPKKGWRWVIPMVLYLGFAVAHEFIFVYVTGFREWSRVLSLHALLFLTVAFVYGLWFYSMIPGRIRTKLIPLAVLGALGLCIKLFSGFGQQLYSAVKLKKDYETRMVRVLSYAELDTLNVEPMNYQGALYFEDLSENPEHWINQDFTKAYGLEFKVATKNDLPKR